MAATATVESQRARTNTRDGRIGAIAGVAFALLFFLGVHHKRFIAFAALPAIVAAAILLGPGASAQSGRTLTSTELEKGSTFIHIRNTKTKSPQSDSLGDVLAFTNPLADSSKRVVGKLHVNCTTTVGASNFLKSVITCSGILVLRDGTLAMQANVTPGASTTTGAVTGGTGAYANARGTLVSKAGANGSTDTLTLADWKRDHA